LLFIQLDPGESTMHTALLCVLVAGLLPYLFTGVAKAIGPRYDNRDVRSWHPRLTGLAYRAHAAHLNSFEAFPFFAAAVLAAMVAGADAARVNLLAIAFVVSASSTSGSTWQHRGTAQPGLVGALGCAIAIFVEALRAIS
jgi:uncharacterized MAPEG superfamily protein